MATTFRPVEYMRPDSVEQAVVLLGEAPFQTRIIAGGSDLLVQKPAGVRRLVDVSGLGIDKVEWAAQPSGLPGGAGRRALRVGAAVTAAELAQAAALLSDPCWRLLAEAAGALGTPLVRSRATIGGNLCNASPAADLAVAVLALGASVEMAGPSGGRTLPVEEFFVGPGRTALEPGELVTAVILPEWSDAVGAFLKLRRQQSSVDIATVNVGVVLSVADGAIAAARVALGAVAETPLLSPAAAAALVGRRASEEAAAAAGAAAAAEIRPIDDMRASAAYRRTVTAILVRRAVAEALERWRS